jgi:hypothetical protein
MSYLRYLCLFAHSGIQHLLCCDFALFVCMYIMCSPVHLYHKISYIEQIIYPHQLPYRYIKTAYVEAWL